MAGYNPRIPDETRIAIMEQVRGTERLYADIAIEFGVSRFMVSKLARENGFRRRRRRRMIPMTPELEEAIASEFDKDELTAEAIGAKYGKSKVMALRIARELRPNIDLDARGRRIAMKTRFGIEPGSPGMTHTERAMKYRSKAQDRKQRKQEALERKAERRRAEWDEESRIKSELAQCPREQKITQSRREAQSSPHCRDIAQPFMSWADIAAELKRRYEEGEEELKGSFDQRSLNMVAMKALEKIRPYLEQYEYPDDTPNRSFAHLRETV
jgi:hypothetical protein